MNHITEPNIPAELEILNLLRAERPELFALLARMADLLLRKGRDYAGKGMPAISGNLIVSEEIGLPAYVGVWLKAADKWQRLKNFMITGVLAVSEEDIDNTCLDLANFSLLWMLAFDRAKQANESPSRPAGTAFGPLDQREPTFNPKGWARLLPKESPSLLADVMENPGRRGVG